MKCWNLSLECSSWRFPTLRVRISLWRDWKNSSLPFQQRVWYPCRYLWMEALSYEKVLEIQVWVSVVLGILR